MAHPRRGTRCEAYCFDGGSDPATSFEQRQFLSPPPCTPWQNRIVVGRFHAASPSELPCPSLVNGQTAAQVGSREGRIRRGSTLGNTSNHAWAECGRPSRFKRPPDCGISDAVLIPSLPVGERSSAIALCGGSSNFRLRHNLTSHELSETVRPALSFCFLVPLGKPFAHILGGSQLQRLDYFVND